MSKHCCGAKENSKLENTNVELLAVVTACQQPILPASTVAKVKIPI
jgi:hypothetical protein